MAFYSHLVQNCDAHVKVMMELEDNTGKMKAVESVTALQSEGQFTCPLKEFQGNRMEKLHMEGSSVSCAMECTFRRKEG
jgi:hypothetical protein